MEVQEALLKRRSVRKFTAEKVSKEDIDVLLHAAMSGPSACNKKPWEFFVVTDVDILDKLRYASKYTNYIAPLAIIVAGNLNKALAMPYTSYWIQDCSAASENILLAATDLNLGSVWCGLHPQKEAEENVRSILKLDDSFVCLNIIFIGHMVNEVILSCQYDENCVHYI